MKGWGTVNEIKVLLMQGKSVSEVARELGIDRKTVRKYRDLDMDQIAREREAGRSANRSWMTTRSGFGRAWSG